ncbi:uridine diphosphate glucose pyrophosphatase NUDT14 [Neodiprion pinetum]|uniref:Uridine diphosphate glucose pyrophosphatase NUDT14 n=1 Tax=Neodiprion lecontei TaxID=441921 RepID=A0A6J0BW72_NEOLC|nr:uridine diphosphate glucose pyrophosphatase NUDT14 [Neodiprion lecontei]XP_046411064.1 uridine diphosphate glucose pyrophosphatase NUDT14-like [Neodiprion fabricii]XP_046470649.1 uridine diphosphate glucose pyrophosphatase NUDT14-like [Neodiprion pinetum]XP_046470650.1 uridine diphosphate glucose pyrophosphatase NUDT14-like [Neodiprion pinetum]XP_046586539.1 uridine diphosphate glucose pyrophosphatase NUDT14 [Neodiprion lecontei]XP_046604442.1 uridine diphosphate glucose pyrophosphatase NUD
MSEANTDRETKILREKMQDLKDVEIGPLPPNSPWVRPVRMQFRQAGKLKKWDLLRIHDSVAMIVFNVTQRKLIFVSQFRPAVFYASLPEKQGKVDLQQYPPSLGVTLELCAGIVDKDLPIAEIAREELLEECGYNAPVSNFVKLHTCRSGVGPTGAMETLFYVEVTDEMRVNSGGGSEVEGELIEVVELSVNEFKEYINRPSIQSPPEVLFAASWFFHNKPEHCS